MPSSYYSGSRAKLVAILFFAAAILTVAPCGAAPNTPNEDQFRSFYDQFLTAVRANDKNKIADLIEFPVNAWAREKKGNVDEITVPNKTHESNRSRSQQNENGFCGPVLLHFVRVPTWSLAEESAQPEPEVLYTSLSGALRIEKITEPSKDGEPATSVWVVSTKNPTQRAKIPKESSDPLLDDDEFNASPNDEWIFGSRHAGSGLRDGTLYHCLAPLSIKLPNTGKSFNLAVWSNSVKVGALKRDYCNEGLDAMTVFVCWSVDSNRVLIRLNGGEEKRDLESGLLYFNTRTNKFEVTDYLRKINKSKPPALVCAEPVDPLPSLADLKARYEKLDQQLNTTYAAVLAKTQKEYVSAVREAQRTWIKRRDEGANIYISLFPQAEREQRRLQFIGDVTAARIEVEPEDWISY